MAKAPSKAPGKKTAEIVFQEIRTGVLQMHLLGMTPLILNRMSEKTWRELLFPSPPKNRAAKASTLKHQPLQEYRASIYRERDQNGGSEILLPSMSFKNAMSVAALDIEGSSKSQIGRLVWVRQQWTNVYGIPELSMMIVRQKDINRTPDVRTRAILPRWACTVEIEFVEPILKGQAMVHLMHAAGLIAGVGDFRQEKGKGNFGQFEIVDNHHKRWGEFQDIVKTGARKPQAAMIEAPECYDDQTAELLGWYETEVQRRGFSTRPAPPPDPNEDLIPPAQPRKKTVRRRVVDEKRDGGNGARS